jgi:hypothetical protein
MFVYNDYTMRGDGFRTQVPTNLVLLLANLFENPNHI